MTIQPAESQFNQIIDKLNQHPVGHKVNPFRLRTLRAEAKKLKQANISEGYTVLGILACLLADRSEMDRCFSAAINTSAQRASTFDHYATALDWLGLKDDAATQLRAAADLEPEDISHLKELIDMYVDCGRANDAMRTLAVLEQRSPGVEVEVRQFIHEVLLPMYEECGLADDDVTTIINGAVNLALDQGFIPVPQPLLVQIDPDDGSSILSIEIRIADTSSAEVARLNFLVAEQRAANQVPVNVSKSVVIVFRAGLVNGD